MTLWKVSIFMRHIFSNIPVVMERKAAAMSGQLTEAQKAVRSDKMLALNEEHAREYEESMIGSELKVLLEEEVEINGEQWYIGHSKEYIKQQ